MEKEQYRSVIRFIFLNEEKCEEIKMSRIPSKDQTPSMTTIRQWFNEFKRGRTSVFDEERSRPRPPVEAATEKVVLFKRNPKDFDTHTTVATYGSIDNSNIYAADLRTR